jgi:hypothetical protein
VRSRRTVVAAATSLRRMSYVVLLLVLREDVSAETPMQRAAPRVMKLVRRLLDRQLNSVWKHQHVLQAVAGQSKALGSRVDSDGTHHSAVLVLQ